MQLHNDFTETTITPVSKRFGSMNVGNRATADLFTGFRIVIRGAPRLNDGGSDSAVRPGGRAERMVMPEHQTQVYIHPPAVTNILRTGNLSGFVGVSHTFGELDGVFAIFGKTLGRVRRDALDPTSVFAIGNFNTNDDISTSVVWSRMARHLNLHLGVSRLGRFQHFGVHRNRHTNMVSIFHLLIELFIRPHRLIVRET